jgi:ABC-type phosphate transport system substrate-binding protein
MKKIKFLVIFSVIFLFLFYPQNSYPENNFVIIINKTNPLDNISIEELRAIFKMERKFWKNGKKIILGLVSYQDERSKVINKLIYKMDEGQLKKFWFTKIFRGQLTSAPITLDSLEESIKFVQNNPGSISYTTKSLSLEQVKVLNVNGFPNTVAYDLDSVKILVVRGL